MQEFQLLTGGRYSPARDGRVFKRNNPVTGAVASVAPAASLADADAAVMAAQAAFPAWAGMVPTERRARLLKAADLLEARSGDFIQLGVAETGGSAGWYGFNVMLA